jgi:TRAP-type C4-dicarboxylate transport system permease small subunit
VLCRGSVKIRYYIEKQKGQFNMAVILKILKLVTRCFMYVSYGAILVLLALTVWDVIARYVFGKPSSGMPEISQMLLIICMTCLAHAIVEGRWINVGVVVDRFPRSVNIGFEIGSAVVSFVFFVIVGYQLLLLSQGSVLLREAYFILGVPRWPMYLVLGVSFLACCLATFVFVIERIQKIKAPPVEENILDSPDLAILMSISDEDGNAAKEGGVK